LNSAQDDIVILKNTAKLDKMVEINLVYNKESKLIQSIKITGDFFIHPEESIEHLEKELCGVKLVKEDLKNKIQSVLKDSQVFGFDVDSLVDVILGSE
jgi:uncharacterized protein YaaN involved in tellurite resistance